MRRYRIVLNRWGLYNVESWRGLWPFWVARALNCHTQEKAKIAAKKAALNDINRSKAGTVVTVLGAFKDG